MTRKWPWATYAVHAPEPEAEPPPPPLTIRDMRKCVLEAFRIPKNTGQREDYERAKRLLDCWFRHLASEGLTPPPYKDCIGEIAHHVGV